MSKLLSFFCRKNAAPVIHKLDKNLDPLQLPPMTAPELIEYLALEKPIRQIRRLSSVNDHYWETLYQQAINNAADLIQLMPASGSHHHAGPGGLLSHTIEVCANTMRIAKAYQLPLGVGPEERVQLDQVWRYGLFAAALLHDVGKTLALLKITMTMKDGSSSPWSPYLGKMPDNTQSYRVQFQPSDYQLYHHLSVSLMDILPRQARHWLLQDKELIKQLMAWLNNDHYECGVIGEIVRQADRESTAADLRLGGHKVRFPGTFQLPMIDRLMTALRHLLHDSSLKLNRNGAAGWIYQGKAYLVCRTVAHAVQNYLQDNGATDIPNDPTRLYDTWQEHGYALENCEGGAIWKVNIKEDAYELNLTVMVFEANRLFKVSHIPADMKGSITVLSQDTKIKTLSQTSASEVEEQTETVINHAPETETNSKPSLSHENTEPGELCTPPPPQQNSDATPLSDSKHEKTGAEPDNRKLAQNDVDQSSNSGAAPIGNKVIPEPDDPDIGEYFLNWVKRSIRDKNLRVNQAKAQVHIIPKGVILISPFIIQKFCLKMGFNEITSGKATWKIVQARFHKLKLHIKTENHVNIHKFQVKGPNRTTWLSGYLLPFNVIYPNGKHPEFNKVIIHVG